jgi:AhpD family alkylhydroperoxidase
MVGVTSHAPRLSVAEVDPEAYAPMLALEKYVHASTLGEDLIALVKIRASQLNGCAYCLDMHAVEARKAGVEQRVLDVVSAWREAPSRFTDRQRAALALTEEVTLIGQAGVSDTTWQQASQSFPEKEIVALLMAVVAINSWNRLAVSTHQALPDVH